MAKATLMIENLVPTFTLPSIYGEIVDTAYFKQRKNLVLVFLHNHNCVYCQRVIRSFHFFASRYREENAEVLFIFPEKIEELQKFKEILKSPCRILGDEEKRVLAKFAEISAKEDKPIVGIFVIDRYGALIDQWLSPGEKDFPNQDRFLTSLNQVEIACPECGI